MYSMILMMSMAQPPATPDTGWKPGPMPANTWGWGGVVVAGSNPSLGFFFADFKGDTVTAINGSGVGKDRTLQAHEVGFYNNSLTLPTAKRGQQSASPLGTTPMPPPVKVVPVPTYQAPPVVRTTTRFESTTTFGAGCSGGGVEGKRVFTGRLRESRLNPLKWKPFARLRGCGG